MKKIIALLLAVGCIFAFASCEVIPFLPGNSGGQGPVDNSAAIDSVQRALDSSTPDIVDIDVVLRSGLGDLNAEYTLEHYEDGLTLLSYSYEKFNTFEGDELPDEIKSTHTGSVYLIDGDVMDESETGYFYGVEAISFKLVLDESKMDSVSASAGTISFKVKAADTEAVLGVALASDADVVISTGSNGVTSISVSYTSASGPVETVSVYTYLPEETEEETDEVTE